MPMARVLQVVGGRPSRESRVNLPTCPSCLPQGSNDIASICTYLHLSAPICNYLVYEAGQIRYYGTEILSRLVADKYRAFDAQEHPSSSHPLCTSLRYTRLSAHLAIFSPSHALPLPSRSPRAESSHGLVHVAARCGSDCLHDPAHDFVLL